jgi:hypothetical protein
VRLQLQLLEDRLGDVVVAPPVGGALGVGELVEVVPAAPVGQALGLGVHVRAVLHEVAARPVPLDERHLLRAGRARHDRHERHPDQPREVRLGHRRRPELASTTVTPR